LSEEGRPVFRFFPSGGLPDSKPCRASQRCWQRTVAVAPEAGSERLRKVINKHLTRDRSSTRWRVIGGCRRLQREALLPYRPSTRPRRCERVLDWSRRSSTTSSSRPPPGQDQANQAEHQLFIPSLHPFSGSPWHGAEPQENQKWLRRRLAGRRYQGEFRSAQVGLCAGAFVSGR